MPDTENIFYYCIVLKLANELCQVTSARFTNNDLYIILHVVQLDLYLLKFKLVNEWSHELAYTTVGMGVLLCTFMQSSVTLFVHIWLLSSWWADSGWWIDLFLDDFVDIEIHMLMLL